MAQLLENTEFRERTEDLDEYVFYAKQNPLIVIKLKGETTYYRTKGEKQNAINEIDYNKDLVLFSWGGQWSTDVFQLTKKDVQNIKNGK